MLRERFLRALLLCITVSSPSLASSEALTTSGMLEGYCQDAIDSGQHINSVTSGICLGVIKGVIDTSITYQNFMKSQYNFSPTLCVPADWTVRQGIKVFLKWAKEHPERLHEPETSGIAASHLEAFPCVRQ